MENQVNEHKILNILSKQYQEFIMSNERLRDMILTEEAKDIWIENYHLIDHDYIIRWKNSIFFDELEKEKIRDQEKIIKFLEKNIKVKGLEKLNNEYIYYDIKDKYLIDPMKSFDLISDVAWKLFDIKNENLKYNGEVSILKGNRKIIIKFDDNNYSVKYLNKNIFAEFIITFNPPQNQQKKNILNDISKNNIFDWMKYVDFNNKAQQFTINKYKIPFDIKQKSNNNLFENETLHLSNENIKEVSDYISLSKSSFSNANNVSSFISSQEFGSFLTDVEDYRYIQKYNKTSNACSVMRCLSRIEPIVNYFTNSIKNFKIFSKFQSKSFLNLIRDFFLNLFGQEKTPYAPKEFTSYIESKKIINIYEEQDPINFLNYIIEYINQRLNKFDKELNFNFNNIQNVLKDEQYREDLNNIINKNNSIISQNFFGLMLETYECHCNAKIFEKIKRLKIIDIDYLSIVTDFKNNDDSIIQKKIDEFLEYYFLKKNINNNAHYEKCPKCGNKAKIIKKEIIHYPDYLIIRLNIGEFKEKEGFVKNVDIPKYQIKYDKIKKLKDYCSNKSIQYNNIHNYVYNLICMIQYTKIEEKITFLSFCKPFSEAYSEWISFVCNTKPRFYNNYHYEYAEPYILFYKLQNNK